MRHVKYSLAIASLLMSLPALSDDCFSFDEARIGSDEAYTRSFLDSCLAEKDDPAAQHNIGIFYYKGTAVGQDFKEAFSWLRKSAEGGNPDAAYMVGMMYLNGEGTVKDPAEAVRWQRKGAELGSPKSWFELGLYTLYGQNGMEKNVAEGLRLITKAAEAGFADAENQLGYMYVTGSGVAQDLRQAAVWYRKSADQVIL